MSEIIDGIFYINLDKRTDRKEEIESELGQMELKYERFPAILDQNGGIGCAKSHISVLKQAKARGCRHVLVFEDDFQFTVAKDALQTSFQNFFAQFGETYDACLLAGGLYNVRPISPSPSAVVGRVLAAQTTSAYLVNGRYIDTLVDCFQKGLDGLVAGGHPYNYSIDMVWKELQQRDAWYYFTPLFGRQRPSFSDITNKFEDYHC